MNKIVQKTVDSNSFSAISASVILALLIALTSLLQISRAAMERRGNRSYELVKGLEYLKAAEAENPETANNLFRERQKARAEAARNAAEKAKLISDLKNDRIDVFSAFKDYVILGDSRAYGYSHFGFLNHRRVLAGGGDTIIKVREYMDNIKKLDPSYIYLCYGVNDAGTARWKTNEAYIEEVSHVINELKQALPDAKIILSSAIWISEDAYNRFPKWGRIYQFNPEYKRVCEENGIIFADNDDICQLLKSKKMWSGDGIHLSKSFYKYWAKNLLLAALEDGQNENSDL